MPVSVMSTLLQMVLVRMFDCTRTDIARGVNLMALLSKFVSTWLTRSGSVRNSLAHRHTSSALTLALFDAQPEPIAPWCLRSTPVIEVLWMQGELTCFDFESQNVIDDHQ